MVPSLVESLGVLQVFQSDAKTEETARGFLGLLIDLSRNCLIYPDNIFRCRKSYFAREAHIG